MNHGMWSQMSGCGPPEVGIEAVTACSSPQGLVYPHASQGLQFHHSVITRVTQYDLILILVARLTLILQ